MSRTALVDLDIVLHQCGHSVDKTTYTLGGRTFGDAKTGRKFAKANGFQWMERVKHVEAGDLEKAFGMVDWRISHIQKQAEADELRLFLSGPDNFRKDVATIQPYKGNRDPAHRPKHEASIRGYMIEKHGAELIEGKEADDAMGLNQTEDTIICTIDKDLLMIPGWHYNWIKEITQFVSPLDALKTFYAQLLSGDKADHIPGVKGFDTPKGIDRAKALIAPLETEHEMRMAVAHEYGRSAYEDEEAAMQEIGSLLWIQQADRQQWLVT